MRTKIIQALALVAFIHLLFDIGRWATTEEIRTENPIHQMDDLDYGIGLYHDSITVKDEYGLDTTVHYQDNLNELFLELNL